VFLVAGLALFAFSYNAVRDNMIPVDKLAAIDARAAAELSAPKPANPTADAQKAKGSTSSTADASTTQKADFDRKAAFATRVAQLRAELRTDTLHSLAIRSLVLLAALIAASAAAGWLLAGRALRPIRTVTDTARKAADLDLSVRIAHDGPADEVKDLADTFDHMLARIDTSLTAQRLFAANASHELRTPLTIIRTSVDVALAKPDVTVDRLREMGIEVRDAADRAQRLVESLLELAQAEDAIIDHETVDLAEAARYALEHREEPVAPDLTVTTNLAPAPTIGNGLLLTRMVANVITNAFRHNHAGGHVTVTTGTDTTTAFLTVDNSGLVIEPEVTSRLTKPFQRGTTARTNSHAGTGLGLTIVDAIVHRHQGELQIKARPEGGAKVTIRLDTEPSARPPLGPTPL
jgi:signal transduction histidine kinase